MDALTAYEQYQAHADSHTLTPADLEAYEADFTDDGRIHTAAIWRQDLVDHFNLPPEQTGDPLPWSKTHSLVRLRPGEVSVWHGGNGSGKSMLLGEVILSLALQGIPCLIASMEMTPVQTLARMCRQCTEKAVPSPMDVDRFLEGIGHNLWMYDQVGTVSSQRIFGVIRAAREGWKMDHIVIDSLMKCGIHSDDLNAQKAFADKLSTYAKDTGAHIHLVAHNRKSSGQQAGEDQYAIKGASEISDMADNVFGVWRNREKERRRQEGDESEDVMRQPDTVLNVTKQRHGEWEGRILLWFHKGTLQYVGENTRDTIPFLKVFGGVK